MTSAPLTVESSSCRFKNELPNHKRVPCTTRGTKAMQLSSHDLSYLTGIDKAVRLNGPHSPRPSWFQPTLVSPA